MAERGILQAEQRVREMNEMARQYVRQSNDLMRRRDAQPAQAVRETNFGQQPRFEPMTRNTAPMPEREQCVPPPALPPSAGTDGETLLVLLMMYILMKEKADIKLILALGYLLL